MKADVWGLISQKRKRVNILYNYVTNILLDRVFSKKLLQGNEFYFIASRRESNKFLNENFKNYISQHNTTYKIHVEIKTPTQEKCLQVVDFLSWGIFRKYEHRDDSYYNLYKESIIEENSLF